MPYRVDYHEDGKPAWSDISFADFEFAKSVAQDAVDNGLAQRVEVRDGGGTLLFHYPRIMRTANRA